MEAHYILIILPVLASPLLHSRVRKAIHPAIHVLALPVVLIIHRFEPLRHNKKVAKLGIGTAIMLSGTYMATNPWHAIPHFLWDAVAYSLHGYGLIPFLKLACMHLDLEIENEKARELEHSGLRRHRLRKWKDDPVKVKEEV